MKILAAKEGTPIHIGYEGESNVTQIEFAYDESWLSLGDGEFKIRVLRPGESDAYNAQNVMDDRENLKLTMTVTDVELSIKGRGELQLCYICDGAIVKKSPIYGFKVDRAIDSEVINPPKGNVVNELVELVGDLDNDIGDLSDLGTTDKSSVVAAINEIGRSSGGIAIIIDSELSSTSENPVQNKVIAQRLDGITLSIVQLQTDKLDASSIDSELSSTSENPVQNKIVNAGITSVQTTLNQRINTTIQSINTKADKTVATTSANGLMSSEDKSHLDELYSDYSSALVALGVIQ